MAQFSPVEELFGGRHFDAEIVVADESARKPGVSTRSV